MPRAADKFWDRLTWTSEFVKNRDWAQGAMNRTLLDHLAPEAGDSVLDLGCGAGPNFPVLREAVGPTGSVLGIDLSPRMLQRAQHVIEARHWENVEVRRADLTHYDLGQQCFDRAVANFSISAARDVPAVLSNVHGALRPGGKLFVADMRLVPRGWATPLIHLARGLYRNVGGWTGTEVLDALTTTFDTVDLAPPRADRSWHHGGWPPVFTALATR